MIRFSSFYPVTSRPWINIIFHPNNTNRQLHTELPPTPSLKERESSPNRKFRFRKRLPPFLKEGWGGFTMMFFQLAIRVKKLSSDRKSRDKGSKKMPPTPKREHLRSIIIPKLLPFRTEVIGSIIPVQFIRLPLLFLLGCLFPILSKPSPSHPSPKRNHS